MHKSTVRVSGLTVRIYTTPVPQHDVASPRPELGWKTSLFWNNDLQSRVVEEYRSASLAAIGHMRWKRDRQGIRRAVIDNFVEMESGS